MSNRQISKETVTLIEARKLIEHEEHWTQSALYRFTPSGNYARCALGAVLAADARSVGGAISQLDTTAREMGHASAVYLNNMTDHATVLEMFDKAIDRSMRA